MLLPDRAPAERGGQPPGGTREEGGPRTDSGTGTWPSAFLRAFLLCVAVWIVLEVLALVLGLAVVGRHGGGPIKNWDDTVEQWSIAHRGPLIGVSEVIAFAGDAPFLAVISVLVTVLLLFLGQRMRAFVPVVAYLGGEAIVFVTRQVVRRPRPPTAVFPAPHAVPGVHETSYSYPSGHATAAVAVIVSLAALAVMAWPVVWSRVGAIVLVLGALFVAWTRLVLGVHWFSDVAFGILFGIAWGITVAVVFRDLPWPFTRSGRPRHSGADDASPGPRSWRGTNAMRQLFASTTDGRAP